MPSVGIDATRPPTSSRMELWGVDFSCAPSRRKPITVAKGWLDGEVLHATSTHTLPTLSSFEALLCSPSSWYGAFDLPFGLPRLFVDSLSLGSTLEEVLCEVHRRCAVRKDFRRLIDAWGSQRPAGNKLPHRRTDHTRVGITSTSPLQTRYVPVGLMYYEGMRRLIDADVTVPGLRAGRVDRQAVEAYPAALAHTLMGRTSYKNAADGERRAARATMLRVLTQGLPSARLRLQCPRVLQDEAVDDASGDRLDALLCLVQAAWASRQPRAGMPDDVDPVEGWIVGA